MLLRRLGERAKLSRLDMAMSRQKLSELSAVPESTLKRFENTGEIGTASLVMILFALGHPDQIEALFAAQPPTRIEDILRPARKRGKRSDAGARRVGTGASS